MALSEADQKALDKAFARLLQVAGLPNGLPFQLSSALSEGGGLLVTDPDTLEDVTLSGGTVKDGYLIQRNGLNVSGVSKYSFGQDVTFQVDPDTSGTGTLYTIRGAEGLTGNSLLIHGGDGQVFLTDTGGSLTLRGGGVAATPGNLNLQGSKENHPISIYGNINIGQIGTAAIDVGGPSLLLRSQSVALSLEDWTDTPGDITGVTSMSGLAAIAAAASSVTVGNAGVAIGAIVFAWVQQAVADVTLTHVLRTSVNPAGGEFTIYGNAPATADTIVGWIIINPTNVWEPPP